VVTFTFRRDAKAAGFSDPEGKVARASKEARDKESRPAGEIEKPPKKKPRHKK